MSPLRFTESFKALFSLAGQLSANENADAVLLLVDGPTDWTRLKNLAETHGLVNAQLPSVPPRFIVAVPKKEDLREVQAAGLVGVCTRFQNLPVYDRVTQALLEAIADDLLSPDSRVVAIYSGFDAENVDSLSVIDLSDRLNRLTGRDLRELENVVPLNVLRTVVDLAVEIGREGREGKAVGTMFVVGDTRRVLNHSRPVSFDPVRGYSRQERNLADPKVREAIKEIAQLDGAIIVAPDGTVEATCRFIDAPADNITLSKGLGARHWAAAAISRVTRGIAVTVSQSNGTVRIFKNGEVILRIEPHQRRALVWREFERERPASESSA